MTSMFYFKCGTVCVSTEVMWRCKGISRLSLINKTQIYKYNFIQQVTRSIVNINATLKTILSLCTRQFCINNIHNRRKAKIHYYKKK